MKKISSFKRDQSSSHESHGHNLTSLVDCFAIILVYLLLATSFGEIDLEIPKDMVLPKATKAQSLTQSLIVLVKHDGYQVGDKQFSIQELGPELKRLADSQDVAPENKSIVIQSDRQTPWSELNPAVVASLQAGFSEVQFAVLKEEKL